ncbi:maltose 6'-phosphate phosphatase [Pilibacter termitis]|uniref:Maltose 6'-phosphate phosphatase n=1 Tax=Pilibacter termitis TaxID=263852 RepID=A0A1T4L0K9_9ENTE|nr:endonuclease/exonuclease/phosphatase family protein [Pilibacter termitis]SJZ48141.1 maltose 6'-phosphate phosphatase [Pilibacter termitis]
MKVLTLNTHSWMEEDPLVKLEILAQFIIEKDCDLIALQEVNQLMSESVVSHEFYKAPENSVELKKDNFACLLVERLRELGVNYSFSWQSNHIGYDKYDEGVAILSKFKIEEITTIEVSKARSYDDFHTRNILGVKVKTKEQMFHIFSTHYSWWEDFVYEWERTRQYLATLEEAFILCGDFNNPANVENEGYDYLMTSMPKLQDSFLSAKIVNGEFTVEKEIDGWSGNKSGLRIDYCFCSEKWRVKKHEVVFNGKNQAVISDHFGILVEIE